MAEVLGQALVDEEYRAALFSDREGATRDFGLTPEDHAILDRMRREDLEDHIENVGGTTSWKVMVQISKSF